MRQSLTRYTDTILDCEKRLLPHPNAVDRYLVRGNDLKTEQELVLEIEQEIVQNREREFSQEVLGYKDRDSIKN